MAKSLKSIDVSGTPELLRIAREVGASGFTHVLRDGDKDLAVVVPLPKRRRKRELTDSDRAAFHASFGGWKDVDTDALLRDIYEARLAGDRPPVEL